MVRKRKVPERTCTACRDKKPKRDMIRIVRSPDRNVLIDSTGKKSGRGAYICGNSQCFNKARKSGALNKALGVNIPDDIWEELLTAVEKSGKERVK